MSGSDYVQYQGIANNGAVQREIVRKNNPLPVTITYVNASLNFREDL